MHMCVFVYVRERQSSVPLLSLCVQCSDRCLCVGAGLARHLSLSLFLSLAMQLVKQLCVCVGVGAKQCVGGGVAADVAVA